jgi:hypothetical protein
MWAVEEKLTLLPRDNISELYMHNLSFPRRELLETAICHENPKI